MIFSHIPSGPETSPDRNAVVKPLELWIAYPIIAFCTFRPAAASSRQPSSIRLRCRDFTFVCFYFYNEANARAAYESIRSWTCRTGRIEKLYAFAFQPPPPEAKLDGWGVYDARKEWARLGVGKDAKSNWRISNINIDYTVCAK